jgi:hypothetical protein
LGTTITRRWPSRPRRQSDALLQDAHRRLGHKATDAACVEQYGYEQGNDECWEP